MRVEVTPRKFASFGTPYISSAYEFKSIGSKTISVCLIRKTEYEEIGGFLELAVPLVGSKKIKGLTLPTNNRSRSSHWRG
jgi:hypothetical protein